MVGTRNFLWSQAPGFLPGPRETAGSAHLLQVTLLLRAGSRSDTGLGHLNSQAGSVCGQGTLFTGGQRPELWISLAGQGTQIITQHLGGRVRKIRDWRLASAIETVFSSVENSKLKNPYILLISSPHVATNSDMVL